VSNTGARESLGGVFLRRVLGVQPREVPTVLALAGYVGLVTGALVMGRTARDALLLSTLGKEVLPRMYVLSALVAVAIAWVYGRVGPRFSRGRANLVTAATWTAALLLFFVLGHLGQLPPQVLYVAVEAIGGLLIMQAWGYVQDQLDLRESKRLFGLIGSGGHVTAVVFSLGAAAIAQRLGILAVVAATAITVAAVVAWLGWLSRTRPEPLEVARQAPVTTSPRGASALELLSNPHLRTIAVVTTVSALVVHLVDFQFKAAASASFSDAAALGGFFGRFHAMTNAVGLLVHLGLTSRVLRRTGTLGALVPFPAALAAAVLSGLVVPAAWAANAAKAVDQVFRFTLHDASMQLLYAATPAGQRTAAKAFIDGMLRPLMGVVAGFGLPVVLAAARSVSIDAGTLISGLILFLVVVWVAAVLRGRQRYLGALAAGLTAPAPGSTHGLRRRSSRPEMSAIVDETALDRLGDPNPDQVAASLSEQWRDGAGSAVRTLTHRLSDQRPTVRAAAIVVMMREGGPAGIAAAAGSLEQLLEAGSVPERALAAWVLGELRLGPLEDVLLRFLDDPAEDVQRAAVKAIARTRTPHLVRALMGPVGRGRFLGVCLRALQAEGERVMPMLAQTLATQPLAPFSRGRLLATLVRLNVPTASLLTVLGSPFGPARRWALRGLERLARVGAPWPTPTAEALERAVRRELEVAEHYTWLVRHAGLDSTGTEAERALASELRRQIDHSVGTTLRLLQLLKPVADGEHLVAGLASPDARQRAHAVELLESVLSGEVRDRLLSVVEERPLVVPPPAFRSRLEWLATLLGGLTPELALCSLAMLREEELRRATGPLQRAAASWFVPLAATSRAALNRLRV
jgi:ATP/ADP translocase/HEAT repeat protein